MKKTSTLLLLILSLFGSTIKAQTTAVCNAEFTMLQTNGNTVQFNPVMPGDPLTTHHYWTFGDGAISSVVAPSHSYTNNGTYIVKHYLYKTTVAGTLDCIDSALGTVLIQQAPCNLVADFVISPVTTTPNTYHFQNTTTPLNTTDSMRWTFGDGSSSTQFSPNHTYTQPGTYTVCLHVKKVSVAGSPDCVSETCHTLVVGNPCTLVASFVITPLTNAPNSYHFENTSTPLNSTDSILWTFGDGTSSTDLSPHHSYAQSGTYTVCLHVKKAISATNPNICASEICHTVVVGFPCNLVAGFVISPVTTTPNTYHFQNTTTPLNTTDSMYWTFGDGSSSTQFSPNHTYTQPGTYNVCLHVRTAITPNNPNVCVSEICHTVVVTAPCTLVASFNIIPLSTTAPVAFHFENTSTPLDPTDSIRWTFGDGSSSNDVSPTHTYTQPGTYTVCLRVQKRDANGGLTDCIRETCHTVLVSAPCTLVAGFVITPVTSTPNTYHFQNTTTPLNTTDSIYWTFGDGTSSTQFSPNHTYTQPGTYNVCLHVKTAVTPNNPNVCVSEICHTVVVTIPCTLVASFTITPITTAPNSYHFENTSAPLSPTDSIRWTFGDGTSSTDLSPNHTYAQAGTYTVCLRVKKVNNAGNPNVCVSEICHTVVVTNPCTLVASFVITPLTTAANAYHFENTSTPLDPTDSIRWTFGDGSSSNDVSPNHTYTQSGPYVICLRVQKRDANGGLTDCIRETCHTILISNPCTLVASFVITPLTTSTPIAYHFENTSTPLGPTDSIRWTFGDGTSSNDVSPTHTYTQAGTYNVCLRVQKRDPNGGLTDCIRETCHTVVVQQICNLHAQFSWQANPSNANQIIFTNQTIAGSTNVSATWSFGDGSSSTVWSPVHEYAQPGRYYVCLRVQLSGTTCVNYFCDSVTVQGNTTVNCNHLSEFSVIRASSNSQLFYFTPLHINTTWQYTWTFGDGTGSHNIYTSHQYAQPGNYTACLTVYHDSTCASTTCMPINVTSQFNCDSVHVSYSYQHDPAIVNKLYFHTTSNFSVLDETWTITRVSPTPGGPSVILHQTDPYYIFPDTGYYVVCLHAVTIGNCIKEDCQTIHIGQVTVNTSCTLQAYPNPANNEISVNVFLAQPQMINVFIYNSLNVLVLQSQQAGVAGNNVVTTQIANLSTGYYTMKLIHGNDICYAQFLKL